MIFVIHSDDIAATFFVRVFTDYFFVFSIHWIFHFRSDAARCKNRMRSCRVILFLLFSVRGG
jgi:hypothetical protein